MTSKDIIHYIHYRLFYVHIYIYIFFRTTRYHSTALTYVLLGRETSMHSITVQMLYIFRRFW